MRLGGGWIAWNIWHRVLLNCETCFIRKIHFTSQDFTTWLKQSSFKKKEVWHDKRMAPTTKHPSPFISFSLFDVWNNFSFCGNQFTLFLPRLTTHLNCYPKSNQLHSFIIHHQMLSLSLFFIIKKFVIFSSWLPMFWELKKLSWWRLPSPSSTCIKN